jgi:hypothetical protein
MLGHTTFRTLRAFLCWPMLFVLQIQSGIAQTSKPLFRAISDMGTASMPESTLLIGGGGVLYGTTTPGSGHGTVYQLTPPSIPQGGWAQSVIYTFMGADDGATPFGTLAMDGEGNIFGTTQVAGAFGYGTVFELSPPGAGPIPLSTPSLACPIAPAHMESRLAQIVPSTGSAISVARRIWESRSGYNRRPFRATLGRKV